ncbi:MAG: hypothetical protein C4518_12765 [Desulfobacteraceae bacterium]|nr:MAG: hypothetical protein C4518_12765 [Desulfobacteraceae bacterium]
MDNKQLMNQVIKFNKTILDNAFKAMTMAQEQGEKMITSTLDQASWIPEEGKKAIVNWVKAYQKGSETFKATVDEQYKKVEDYFSKS